MKEQFFGTDGVRGTVGSEPMTADFAMRLASAAAQVLVPKGGTVVIGKDTRLSGYMFESALEAGFVAAGADVLLLGPLPTPGIARLTQEFDADLGVVISASHNAYYDNGIKFFDPSGSKLTDEIERKIEKRLTDKVMTLESRSLGKAKRIDTARVRYQEFCAASMPKGLDLTGLKIVFDGANGAAYKVGPRTLGNLGADVIPIGCSPNGKNINDGCGSTEPGLLKLTVPALNADVGVALDGDGDRLVMVAEDGQLIDGDQTIARHREATLEGPIVGTVMSNFGLEKALKSENIEFHRADVGDRHVLEALRASGGIIGGETSGHIIVLDKATTGDGLISALQVLAIMKKTGKKLSELVASMPKYPQILINVQTKGHLNLKTSTKIQAAVALAEDELADNGRVVLRASGTEPVIRVMVEGEHDDQVDDIAKRLAAVVADSAA
jgi:phosphoglucosamine mutase